MEPKVAIINVLNRCEIIFNGEVIGREHLIRAYKRYLCRSALEDRHNVCFAMHTGSICFDIISFLFAAVSTLAMNEGEVESIINSLENGDVVVYEKNKYRFEGFEEIQFDKDSPIRKYAVLVQDKGNLKNRIPETKWYLIKPYMGDSKTLDGRGLRGKHNKRNQFMSQMFDMKEEEIPSVIESSSVIVMPRWKAEEIANNVILHDTEEGGTYNLLDLVTVSYFTEGEEYRFSGNSEKNEPNIKVTSKLSVARELVYQPLNNKMHGLVVLDSDGANQSRTELDELINRRSLKYVLVSYHIDSERGDEMVAAYEDANLFACTREFLLQNSLPVNTYNTYTANLDKQVDIILNKEIETEIVPCFIGADEYWRARNNLRFIKNSDFSDEHKDDFVIQAMSMLNLLTSASFTMKDVEEDMPYGVGVLTPKDKIELLQNYTNDFSYTLKDRADAVTFTIKKLYDQWYEQSPKETALKRLLTNTRGDRIAIIIPKAYYEPILKNVLRHYTGTGKITFYTPNKFDNSIIFDRIIILGDYTGKRFNTFKCNSAKKINVFLYDFEKKVFEYRRKSANKLEWQYNRRINLVTDDDYDESVFAPDTEEKELTETASELDEFIESMNSVAIKNYATSGIREGTSLISAVRVGKFTEGESILFSKNYKAIVFNPERGEVTETAVEDLDSGDVLVFTKNDRLTKGIVDEILENLLDRGLLGQRVKSDYDKSIYWKDALRQYVSENNISYEELGKQMAKCGSTKNPGTIRNWIQPFSHIVGPKDVDSYRYVAQVTQDELMLRNPQEYCDACSVIRKERVRILKLIAAAIVKKLGGKADTEDKLLKAVYDNIEDLAVRKQLEVITDIKDEYEVPIGMINRPISI